MPCEPNQPNRTPCQSCPSPDDFVRIPQGFGLTRIVREALQTNMELTQCLADFCGVNAGSDEDGGPYDVVDNSDGTLTVTDSSSDQSFTLDMTIVLEHLDFSTLSEQQCQEIANCITDNATSTQISNFTELIDFTQLINNLTPDNQEALCQSIIDAGCDITSLIDLQELSTQQITDLVNIFDFEQLNAEDCQQIFQCILDNGSQEEFDDLCARFGVILNVSTGSNSSTANATQTAGLSCGENLHIFSPDNSVLINVTEGSAIVGLQLNPATLDGAAFVQNNTGSNIPETLTLSLIHI